jgi:hypothetical protein
MALQNDDPFAASPPLTHEKLRHAVTARRIALLKLGYEPIPVQSGDKAVRLPSWQNIPLNIETVGAWAEQHPDWL